MSENNVKNNVGDKGEKNNNYCFSLFIGMVLVFGVVRNQIELCFGVIAVAGLILDYKS